MRIFSVALLLLVASCALAPSQQFKGPSGRTAYSMRCSQIGYSLDGCYRKVGALCSDRYTIIENVSGTVGVPVRGGIMTVPNYNVAVECK